MPNAIALPASVPSRRTRKRRCLPSPTVESASSSQPAASSVTAGLPSPNGASCASSAQRSSVRRRPRGTIASTCVTGARSSSSSSPAACSANCAANAAMFSGLIESPAAARWPPQRSSSSEHAPRPPCRSKLGIERPEPFQSPFAARDQDDGPVELLDEPRGDDADHAFVPVLAGDDVCAPLPVLLGPRLDLGDRLAHDAALDRLPLLVQLLERVRRAGARRRGRR